MTDEGKMADMKLETSFFLKSIEDFTKGQHKIDKRLLGLLSYVLSSISILIDKSEFDNSSANDTNNEFSIDESMFRLQRIIVCRTCCVVFGASMKEYLAHLALDAHKNKVVNEGQEGKSFPIASHNGEIESNESKTSDSMYCSAASIGGASSNKAMLPYRPSEPEVHGHIEKVLRNNEFMVTMHKMNYSENAKTYEKIVQNLKNLIPNSRIFLYGSRMYGLGSSESNLNIYVELEHSYSLQRSHSKLALRQKVMYKKLLENARDWQMINCKYRLLIMPIIEAYNTQLKLECVFSFATGLNVETTKLLIRFINALPIIRPMVMALKYLQGGLNCTSSVGFFNLSTYQWIILVISYFQLQKNLPSVYDLQSNLGYKTYVGDTVVNTTNPEFPVKPVVEPLTVHLYCFFHFFGYTFDYKKHILTPYYGQLINHTEKDNAGKAHSEVLKFIKNSNNKHWTPPHAFMCVTDLFQQSLNPNVTGNLSLQEVETFQRCCKNWSESGQP